MSNKALQAKATSKNGDQLTVHAQETDSPILPVAQLEQLHQFRPDLVDFVIEQTREEANFRRRRDDRVNLYVFIERIMGQLGSIIIAGLGVGGGIYAGLNGQPTLGGVIASVTIGTLAVAYVKRHRQEDAAPRKKN